jgi:putative proteasome-type protease
MTYCVGLDLQGGLVLLSDTRTNAGVDHVSTFSKMHVVEIQGERVIALLSAGNLAVSQAVVNLLNEGIERTPGPGTSGLGTSGLETLASVPSMFRAAQLVGEAIRRVYVKDGEAMQAQNVAFDVSILLGGQIKGRSMRLFQLYSAGNFIEATPDTPYMQIGEHKYGKPILDRVVRADMALEDGVKVVLISMDSTLRSNLSVGLPVDLLVYRRDSLRVGLRRRLTEEDGYFRLVRDGWSSALREAYQRLPRPGWMED